MDILSIVQALLGCIIVFFLSGWLVTSWFHSSRLERLIYSIAISISLTIILALILAYLGIFNILTLLLGYGIVFVALIIFKRYH